MSARELSLDVRVVPVPHVSMPPNCDVLGSVYIGDLIFGLAADPKGRGLYLLAVNGYWYLDTQQLLATFGAALRAWDLDARWTDGRSLTGRIDPGELLIPAPLERELADQFAKASRLHTKRAARVKTADRRRRADTATRVKAPRRRRA